MTDHVDWGLQMLQTFMDETKLEIAKQQKALEWAGDLIAVLKRERNAIDQLKEQREQS